MNAHSTYIPCKENCYSCCMSIQWGSSSVLSQYLNFFFFKIQEKAQAANPQQNGTGKFMKYFFPVLSVFFCLTSNAGFALYWVTSNVVMWVLSIAMTKFLEKQDKKNATAIAGEGTVK